MVVRIPSVLVMWFPLLLFLGEVVLVLTLGPVLIAAARARRNLPPIALSDRVARCFGASVLAILAWMGMLPTSIFIIFSSLRDEHHDTLAVILFCIALLLISFLTFLIPARICAGPIEDVKTAPRRRRYFITPGLLILICIWMFWAVFLPWVNSLRSSATRVINLSRMKGLSTGIELYAQAENRYPDRLGRLVDKGYASSKNFNIYSGNQHVYAAEPVEGQPYRIPKEYHYLRLPDDAPGNLVWLWFDPTIFDGKPVPVVYKAGHVDLVPPKILCAELFDSYQWLLAPEKNKPSIHEREWDNTEKNYIRFRVPQYFLHGLLPLHLFLVEVIVVLTAGPFLIGLACRNNRIPPPTIHQRVSICFRASVRGIGLWWLSFYACVLILAFSNFLYELVGIHFPPFLIALFVVGLFAAAFIITLRYTAKRCMPKELQSWTSKERLYGPAILIVISTVLWGFCFLTTFQHSARLPRMVIDQVRLQQIKNSLNEYNVKHNCYPEKLLDLTNKDDDNPYSIFSFPTATISSKELKDNPDLLSQKVRYCNLPQNAPGELLWVWPEPSLYHDERSPVLLKNGDVEMLWPEEIAEKIGRTYEWLLEHRNNATTMPSTLSVPKGP